MARAADTDPERLRWLFREVVGRLPDAEEEGRLLRSLHGYRQRFATEPERARELIEVGEIRIPTDLDPAALAAWTVVCSTVLNLDEALNVE